MRILRKSSKTTERSSCPHDQAHWSFFSLASRLCSQHVTLQQLQAGNEFGAKRQDAFSLRDHHSLHFTGDATAVLLLQFGDLLPKPGALFLALSALRALLHRRHRSACGCSIWLRAWILQLFLQGSVFLGEPSDFVVELATFVAVLSGELLHLPTDSGHLCKMCFWAWRL